MKLSIKRFVMAIFFKTNISLIEDNISRKLYQFLCKWCNFNYCRKDSLRPFKIEMNHNVLLMLQLVKLILLYKQCWYDRKGPNLRILRWLSKRNQNGVYLCCVI